MIAADSTELPARRAGTRGVPRAERERQILDVAGRTFATCGYHAASMDEIAAQAGVSKPMVYAYFRSKEALYLAYIERAGGELLERMRLAAAQDLEPEERIRAGIDELFRFVDEHRHGWTVLYTEAAARGGAVAEGVASMRARLADGVCQVLREVAAASGRGELSPTSLEGLAHASVGAGESLANWWLARESVDRETVADWLFRLTRAGLAAVLGEGRADAVSGPR